jgi:methylated-DNA-protein-cysteine methyltransferase related protein
MRRQTDSPTFYEAAWDLARRIPSGRVVSYSQIATWLGSPRAARAVGYAMFNVKDEDVPWHRVINAKGEISIGGATHRPELQRRLLESEGVRFDARGRVDLRAFGWRGPAAARMWRHPYAQQGSGR